MVRCRYIYSSERLHSNNHNWGPTSQGATQPGSPQTLQMFVSHTLVFTPMITISKQNYILCVFRAFTWLYGSRTGGYLLLSYQNWCPTISRIPVSFIGLVPVNILTGNHGLFISKPHQIPEVSGQSPVNLP